MSQADHCPNCGEKLKSGMFGNNSPFDDDRMTVINMVVEEPMVAACNSCGDDAYAKAWKEVVAKRRCATAGLEAAIGAIPIVSIHSPQGWDYEAIGVVTAQSTTGTGIWSDVTSAFTDLFGAQSGVYNQKILAGEELCKKAIRVKALSLGCNAVVAADIDYAEVGGTRAMLMVCMTGTAVRLRNVEALGTKVAERLGAAAKLYDEVQELSAVTVADYAPGFVPQ